VEQTPLFERGCEGKCAGGGVLKMLKGTSASSFALRLSGFFIALKILETLSGQCKKN